MKKIPFRAILSIAVQFKLNLVIESNVLQVLGNLDPNLSKLCVYIWVFDRGLRIYKSIREILRGFRS